MAEQRTIWTRRVVLMVVVGLIVAIPLTIAGRGDDEADDQSASPSAAAPLGPVEVDRKLGVKFRLPDGWRSHREDELLILSSRNRDARISVSAPGPDKDADVLYSQAIARFRDLYRDFQIVKRVRGRLGGLRSQGAEIAAKAPRTRVPQRILVSTAAGDKRAYLVVIFTTISATASLIEAQAVLNTLRLRN